LVREYLKRNIKVQTELLLIIYDRDRANLKHQQGNHTFLGSQKYQRQ